MTPKNELVNLSWIIERTNLDEKNAKDRFKKLLNFLRVDPKSLKNRSGRYEFDIDWGYYMVWLINQLDRSSFLNKVILNEPETKEEALEFLEAQASFANQVEEPFRSQIKGFSDELMSQYSRDIAAEAFERVQKIKYLISLLPEKEQLKILADAIPYLDVVIENLMERDDILSITNG